MSRAEIEAAVQGWVPPVPGVSDAGASGSELGPAADNVASAGASSGKKPISAASSSSKVSPHPSCCPPPIHVPRADSRHVAVLPAPSTAEVIDLGYGCGRQEEVIGQVGHDRGRIVIVVDPCQAQGDECVEG
jgi:hypothetical protein